MDRDYLAPELVVLRCVHATESQGIPLNREEKGEKAARDEIIGAGNLESKQEEPALLDRANSCGKSLSAPGEMVLYHHPAEVVDLLKQNRGNVGGLAGLNGNSSN